MNNLFKIKCFFLKKKKKKKIIKNIINKTNLFE